MKDVNACSKIRSELLSLADIRYRDFSSALMPSVDKARVIGIRIPVLRKYAKALYKSTDGDVFMSDLPHAYFEENNLHAFLICRINDYGECIRRLDAFLPYVDNWATCDSMRPSVFKTHTSELIGDIFRWMSSEHPYTVRFGIEMLMIHFLGDRFKTEYADAVACVRSGDYYVNMMIAWYFATALATNWDDVIPYVEDGRLYGMTHNKTIQKAVESFRIDAERKAYLKTLKR